MSPQFTYFAFISYNSNDTEWGKRLQRKLEHYRMPATLCSEHGWERTPIKPVFFAPTDIQPGGLTEELQGRLQASRNLIVICSPNSARSKWVGQEIEFFHQLGRTKQIHFFIVDGQPHSGNSETECFNPIVKTLGLPEILGANIHEKVFRWPWLNKERAYVQLISKLLGVEFDAIWQRHKRLLVEKMIAWSFGIVMVMAALTTVWFANQPIGVKVQLNEASAHNPNLPPLQDAVVVLTLENETKTDTIHSFESESLFANIPHRFIGKEAHIIVTIMDVNCWQSFLPVDTFVVLSKHIVIPVHRNEKTYGQVHMQFWNPRTETFIEGVEVCVDGQSGISDRNGFISFFVPLERQRGVYPVSSSIDIQQDSIQPWDGVSSIPTLLLKE